MGQVAGRRRRWLRWSAAVLGTLVLWMIFSLVVIQFPSSDRPSKADAIIVLGEPDARSLAAAERLVAEGVSNTLVLSTPFGEPTICSAPPPGVQVSCFVPDPTTTRGEAQEIARLADAHGWTNIVVVTWPTHLARSEWLIERCYGQSLQMVDYDDGMSLSDRIAENMYQSAAFVKALVQPGC